MITSVNDWVLFLKTTSAAMGFPLVVCGLALMLFGWRMWKVCILLSFGLIGAALGSHFAPSSDMEFVLAIASAGVLATLSYLLSKYAVAVLGGLIGAGVVATTLDGSPIHGPALWAVSAVFFAISTAMSVLYRKQVIVGVTAFLGATLLISGLTAFAFHSSALASIRDTIMPSGAIVVPFMLLVPTVMSCLYQSSEMTRLHANT